MAAYQKGDAAYQQVDDWLPCLLQPVSLRVMSLSVLCIQGRYIGENDVLE